MNRQIVIWEERRVPSKSTPILSKFQQFDENAGVALDLKFGPGSFEFLLAAAIETGQVKVYDFTNRKEIVSTIPVSRACESVSWNKTGGTQMLAVGSQVEIENLASDLLTIWELDESWKRVGDLISKDAELGRRVSEISWAPQNGRSFHYLAAVTERALIVVMFKIDMEQKPSTLVNIQPIVLDHHTDLKWLRVSWNYMATILAASNRFKSIELFMRFSQTEFKRFQSFDSLEKQINTA